MVDHKDGHEENGARSNLRWLCRPCNTLEGLKLKRAGKGRRTVQYNPSEFWIGPAMRGVNRAYGVRKPFATIEAARAAAQKLSDKKRVAYEIRRNDGTGRLVPVERVEPMKGNPSEFSKGDLVRWRGHGPGLYVVNRRGSGGSELRIESADYAGGFHMVSRASLELYRRAGPDARRIVALLRKAAAASNPTKAGGAANLFEYVLAGTQHTRGAHDEGGRIIHLTPKSKRREFAAEIWAKRSAGESARGSSYSDEPDWVKNPKRWNKAKLDGVPVRVRARRGGGLEINLSKAVTR